MSLTSGGERGALRLGGGARASRGLSICLGRLSAELRRFALRLYRLALRLNRVALLGEGRELIFGALKLSARSFKLSALTRELRALVIEGGASLCGELLSLSSLLELSMEGLGELSLREAALSELL